MGGSQSVLERKPQETSVKPPSLRRWEDVLEEEKVIQAAGNPVDQMPSCLKCFDHWASCYALFPQMQQFYRYGEQKNCDEKWQDWKICLSQRGLTMEEKYQQWIQRKAEKSARKRMQHSSEEVWQMRKDPLVNEYYIAEPGR